MAALTKRSEPQRYAPRGGGVADELATYLSRSAPYSGSNFGEQCSALIARSKESQPCDACGGCGSRELDEEEIASRNRRLAAQTSSVALDQIRERLRIESECRKCRGVGYVEVLSMCSTCGGLGTVDGTRCGDCGGRGRAHRAKPGDPGSVTARCPLCRGTGEHEDEDLQDACPLCSLARPYGPTTTKGYVVPVTVWSTGSSKKGRLPPGATSFVDAADSGPLLDAGGQPMPGGVWSSTVTEAIREEDAEVEVFDHGRIGDMLRELDERDEAIGLAVRLYFGPDGDRWGQHAWGRTFVLWQLTEAGLDLVDLAGAPSDSNTLDVIINERNTEATTDTPNVAKRALIRRADTEARLLLDDMTIALQQVRR